MAEYANESRSLQSLSVNDNVWLSTKNLSIEDGSVMRKLLPKFCDSIKIVKEINDLSFRLGLWEQWKQEECMTYSIAVFSSHSPQISMAETTNHWHQ